MFRDEREKRRAVARIECVEPSLEAAIRLTNVSAVFWGIMALTAGAGVAAAIVVGSFRLANGDLSAGQLLLVLLLAGGLAACGDAQLKRAAARRGCARRR